MLLRSAFAALALCAVIMGLIWFCRDAQPGLGSAIAGPASPPLVGAPSTTALPSTRDPADSENEPPAPEKAPVAARHISGWVIDQTTPLRGGSVTAWSDVSNSKYTFGVRADGSFAGQLPPTEFPGEVAQVTVADGEANVFSGLVVIGDGVRIVVNSTARTSHEGRILLPDYLGDGKWCGSLKKVDNGTIIPIGTTDYCSGTVGLVRWSAFDPRCIHIAGAVDLIIMPENPRRGNLGHVRFESTSDFLADLPAGIVLHTPRRSLQLADLPGEEIESVVLLSMENEVARYFANATDNGAWDVSAPAGDYLVSATLRGGGVAFAMVMLMERGGAEVTWKARLPGDGQVSLLLKSPAGLPLRDRVVVYSSCDEFRGMHVRATSQRSDVDGRIVLKELLLGRYQLFAPVAGDRSGVLLGDVDPRVDGERVLTLAESHILNISLSGLSGIGLESLSATDFRVWSRASSSDPWIGATVTDIYRRATAIGPFAEGPREVAVRGEFWAGTAQCTVGQTKMVTVPVTALHPISGRLVSRFHRQVAGYTVRLAGSRQPWATAQAISDGSFVLLVTAVDPSTDHLEILRNGTVACTARIGGASAIEVD